MQGTSHSSRRLRCSKHAPPSIPALSIRRFAPFDSRYTTYYAESRKSCRPPNSPTVFQGPFRRYCLRSGPLLSKVPVLETCVTVMPPWPRPNMQQNYSNVALRVLHQPAAALSPPSSTLDRPSLGKQKESTSRNYKQ